MDIDAIIADLEKALEHLEGGDENALLDRAQKHIDCAENMMKEEDSNPEKQLEKLRSQELSYQHLKEWAESRGDTVLANYYDNKLAQIFQEEYNLNTINNPETEPEYDEDEYKEERSDEYERGKYIGYREGKRGDQVRYLPIEPEDSEDLQDFAEGYYEGYAQAQDEIAAALQTQDNEFETESQDTL